MVGVPVFTLGNLAVKSPKILAAMERVGWDGDEVRENGWVSPSKVKKANCPGK